MEKQSASNSKIKYFLLSILFSILFIFTALNIPTPITAYAEDEGGEDMDLGGGSIDWSVDGASDDYVYIPGKIYWGGSNTRTGLLFYCVDTETGAVIQNTMKVLYNQALDSNGEDWLPKVTTRLGTTRVDDISIAGLSATLKTDIPATGSWENTDGSPVKAWLEGDSTMSLPNGEPVCMAAYLVYRYAGNDAFKKVINQEYTVCFEGMYGMAIYTRKNGMDVARSYGAYYARSNYPDITDEEKLAELSIIKYFTTLNSLAKVYGNLHINITQRYGDNGTANYKWMQSSAKYFRTDEEHFDVPAASSAGSEVTVEDVKTTGWNFAVVEINVPPLHTYDESKGTPGNTQTPDPNDGTDGDCTIKKLYYTQELASDGTILTEAKDYHPYKQTSTTAYISIDTESEYEIEGWKTSTTNTSLNTKEQFGLSTLFQTNFFRLFFRYCTGV